MTNKFVSWLDHVGHDFKKGLDPALKIAGTAGEIAVGIFFPALGPLFSQTVSAIATAEQNAVSLGLSGTGLTQKLPQVVQIMGGLIKQGLADVGASNDDASVEKYISAVVTILKALPASLIANTGTSLSAAAEGSGLAFDPQAGAVVSHPLPNVVKVPVPAVEAGAANPELKTQPAGEGSALQVLLRQQPAPSSTD